MMTEMTKKGWIVIAVVIVMLVGACEPGGGESDVEHPQPDTGVEANPAGYVGSGLCETCHGANYYTWLSSQHNKDINTLDEAHAPGIVADSDFDGVDDFREGIVLGDTSVKPADPDYNQSPAFKPMFDAGLPPILGYDEAKAVPTVTIGPLTYDVNFTLGGKWVQLYATIIDNGWYVLPIQFNPALNNWSVFHGEHWYTFVDGDGDGEYDPGETVTGPLYGAGQSPITQGTTSHSWQQRCAGCHSTGLFSVTASDIGEIIADFSERNTACEACHGPAQDHVNLAGGAGTIINPEDLNDFMAGNMCGRCHTRGDSRFKIAGQSVDWPWPEDGTQYQITDPIEDHYMEATEEPDRWMDVARSAKSNQQQFSEFKNSALFKAGIRCYDCHDPHGSSHPASTRFKADTNQLCLSGHGGSGIGPVLSGASINASGVVFNVQGHTRHQVDPADKTKPFNGIAGRCLGCHMPFTAKSSYAYDIRSHNFKMLWPEESETVIARPNSCMTGVCHTALTQSNPFFIWDPSDPNDLSVATSWYINSIPAWGFAGWPDLPPVASTINTQTEVTLAGGDSVAITLDGTASFDPNGYAVLKRWYQRAGPQTLIDNASPLTADPASVNAKIPGTYVFDLEVEDTGFFPVSAGNIGNDAVEVRVTQ